MYLSFICDFWLLYIYIEFNFIKIYTKYKIVPFCPYHFVRTILSNIILSAPFCPYHFVRYHFVRSPYVGILFKYFYYFLLISLILSLRKSNHVKRITRPYHQNQPSSAISLCPLRSHDHHDLFVPRARTSMAQTRAFAIFFAHFKLVSHGASFHSLKTVLFSRGITHWKHFLLVCTAGSAI